MSPPRTESASPRPRSSEKPAASVPAGAKPEAVLFPGDLGTIDPDIARLVALEDERQERKLVFIASESLCPKAVREATASGFAHLYAEGYPSPRMRENPSLLLDADWQLSHYRRYSDRRYYKGCEYADFVEGLAQRRLAELFANDRVPADKVFANVQPLSGAAANNAVYEAFLRPGEVVLGLNLSHGGHLTHGSPANRSGRNYKAVHYGIDPATGRIDMDAVLEIARRERPKMIIAGSSAYPWAVDWEAFRRVADAVGAVLLADIAHTAGLVAARVLPGPVGVADVVSFTTHKTLCGPRGAAILTTDEDKARRIDRAVFPGEQGGPHVNAIAGKAVAFKLAATPEYRSLMTRVVENSKSMAESLRKRGHEIVYGGTDTHLFLLGLKQLHGPHGEPLSGEIASRILDLAHVTCNKNTVFGDTNAAHPSALRFGTTWVTQRGLGPKDLDAVVEQIDRVLRSARPFRYSDGRSGVPRGKVDFATLESARRAVDAIARRFPGGAETATSGYPHFSVTSVPPETKPAAAAAQGSDDDASAAEAGAVAVDLSGAAPVLSIAGERAGAFLQEAATADVLALLPGAAAMTAFLGADGEPLDPAARIARAPDRAPAVREYRVLPSPGRGETLAAWLRALSDGYVVFDDADLLAKVEGPVSVTEVKGVARIAVFGKKAQEIAAKAAKDAFLPSRPGEPAEIVVPESRVAAILGTLGEMGARRATASAAAALFEKAAPGDGAIARTKPGFVGRAARRIASSGAKLEEWTFELKEGPPRKSCLFDEHRKLTKPTHIVPFAGWSMPVQYAGIQEEHRAVRETAGLFDVTHMGVLGFAGPGAGRCLDLLTANYVSWLRVGQAQYSYLLHPDGHPLDDILVYRTGPERYMVVVNAANCEKAKSWIRAALSGKVVIDRADPGIRVDAECEFWDMKDEGPEKERRADVALQGPASVRIMEAAGGPALARELSRLHRFDFVTTRAIGGLDLVVSRTGYTGEEIGFEIYVSPADAPELWRTLLEKGKPFGLAPAGLGARDSTRTEAGLPLYGHELEGPFDVWPCEAGYGSFVKAHKPWFVGRAPYLARDAARTREIVRFRAMEAGARKLKTMDPVADARGEVIGHVTSCTLVAGAWQGMALVDRRAAKEGTELRVFPLPPGGRAAAEKPASKLAAGDRAILPERAVVLPRFRRV